MARYLGEAGCTVVALEGNPTRAEVAAERCRDLPDVEVVCGTIDDLDAEDRFDIVTVIGVLEYTPATIGGAGGPDHLLAAVRARLGPDGAVVLAIENQLGLKYLLGGAEDHRGAAWVGVEDYPGPPGARTWSRAELERLLDHAGFSGQTWLAPYPDYKLPTVILHDRAFDEPDVEALVDQLVLQPVAFHDHLPARLGDAGAAHGAFIRAGLGARCRARSSSSPRRARGTATWSPMTCWRGSRVGTAGPSGGASGSSRPTVASSCGGRPRLARSAG